MLLEKRESSTSGEQQGEDSDLDSVMNAKRVQELTVEKKRLAEQLRNVEENFQVLKADNDAKTKLIQDLITKEKSSGQAGPSSASSKYIYFFNDDSNLTGNPN